MRTLTSDLVAVLEGGGLTVGKATGAGLTPPFVVVYPLVQQRDGSFENPWSDVRKFYEIIGEGTTLEQAEWLADRVQSLLAASDLVVVSLEIARVDRDDTTGSPSRFKAWTRAELLAHAPTGAA